MGRVKQRWSARHFIAALRASGVRLGLLGIGFLERDSLWIVGLTEHDVIGVILEQNLVFKGRRDGSRSVDD